MLELNTVWLDDFPRAFAPTMANKNGTLASYFSEREFLELKGQLSKSNLVIRSLSLKLTVVDLNRCVYFNHDSAAEVLNSFNNTHADFAITA